ncbi:MAG: MarR family transcriptional regulator [Victivallales bacterium]|nr:MarR family transcriptional regulator [Victivallales bacterium]
MSAVANIPQKLWEKFFFLSDTMDKVCDRLSTPEEVKEYYELTMAQTRAVKLVSRLTRFNPEGVSLKVLSEQLSISAAATSELVEILVKKGWLVREQSLSDRRSVCIRLSGKTQTVVARIHDFFDAAIDDALKNEDPDDVRRLSGLMDRFINKLLNEDREDEKK